MLPNRWILWGSYRPRESIVQSPRPRTCPDPGTKLKQPLKKVTINDKWAPITESITLLQASIRHMDLKKRKITNENGTQWLTALPQKQNRRWCHSPKSWPRGQKCMSQHGTDSPHFVAVEASCSSQHRRLLPERWASLQWSSGTLCSKVAAFIWEQFAKHVQLKMCC